MKKTILLILITINFCAFDADAALIFVNSNLDNGPNDGNCDLRDAVASANTNAAVDMCDAGQADLQDAIIIQSAGPIQLNSVLNIDSGIYISTTFNADPVEIIAAPNSRIMQVTPDSINDNDFTVINLILSQGHATGQNTGGAIYFSNQNAPLGIVEISGVTFDNNHGYAGGAIHFDNSQAESIYIYNSVFTDNSAENIGGAISAYDAVDSGTANGSFRILRSHFQGNSTNGSSGAVFIRDETIETAEISNSQFIGNSSADNAGALNLGAINTNQTFYLDRNLFLKNQAGGDSGALEVSFSSIVYVRESLFAFNSGNRGGAVTSVFDDALLRLSNSTLVHNSASVAGDNIYIFGSGRLIPSRNIIAYPVNGDNCTGSLGTSVTAAYRDNMTDDNTCELLNSVTNTIVTDPLLTGFSEHPDLFPGFAPTVNSSALDATGICAEDDLMERTRPLDGDGNGTASCDIGAVESPTDMDIIWTDAFGI
jgi:predicted outer membrane repeat protein